MASTEQIPKAILYSWKTSVWSTVARLCLQEKGYSEDEYIVKEVDITKGENFSPSYLRININGTIPTLVVPMAETTSSEVDTRFRSLRDTITICDFLDQARVAHTANTTSERPAPVLGPATIEGKAASDKLVAIVHLPSVDPNFLNVCACSANELRAKAGSAQGNMIKLRHENLQQYVHQAEQLAQQGGSFEQQMVAFLKEKQAANQVLYELYQGQAGAEKEQSFFEASSKVWYEGIPDALQQLETSIVGPFALGDQISLADLHIISWLTRCVSIAGGKPDPSGIDALEGHLQGKPVGPKMKAFWRSWVERESYKRECVPTALAFAERFTSGVAA